MPEWKIRFYKWIGKNESKRNQIKTERDRRSAFNRCYIRHIKQGLISEDNKCIGRCACDDCPYREEAKND